MNNLDEKYIEIINIPDIKKDFTANDEKYFVFGKAPLCLYSKKTPLLLFLMIVFYILRTMFSEGIVMWTALLLTIFFCLLFFFENRYIGYYKKASNYSHFGMYNKMMIKLDKLIKSHQVYLIGMPYAYSILKSKQLILSNNFIGAECLVDNVLNTFPNCIEAIYIRGLCLYFRNNRDEAIAILKKVIDINTNDILVNAANNILKELKSI